MEEDSELNLDSKKEIQEKIIETEGNGRVTEEEFLSVLKMVAPGTNLRTALETTLKGGKGALIVVQNEQLSPILDGGFKVNCRFTPQRIAELSKMDGAIIVSKNLKRIELANALLAPDSKIKTIETGTRHKAGERTAKQISGLVIAISERKHDITLYYKNIRYPLISPEDIRRKVNEHIQVLEKQRDLFDKHIEKLNKLELKNYVNIEQAILAIQKGKLITKIAQDIKKNIAELGTDGMLLKTRLKEIISGVEEENSLIIKDYSNLDQKRSKALLDGLSYDDILDPEKILSILAYEDIAQKKVIKGWRILSKTFLSDPDIAKLTKSKGSLGEILHSNAKSYYDVLGEEKANLLKEEVEKIKLNPWQLR